jgi:hypothetical protein
MKYRYVKSREVHKSSLFRNKTEIYKVYDDDTFYQWHINKWEGPFDDFEFTSKSEMFNHWDEYITEEEAFLEML